jgi:hygromycin-B 7''-O-kinase
MNQTLSISEPEYFRRFYEPIFGLDLAQAVCARHSLPQPLTRKMEGSNLIFRIDDGRWLKITPPFFGDSFDAELQVTRGVAGMMPIPVPTILETGNLDAWRYSISTNVPGVQIQSVASDLTEVDFETVALELGQFMACFHKVRIPGFDRHFGPWSDYLERNVRDARRIHSTRGNSPDWVNQIAELLERQHDKLRQLGPPVLIHADLTPEHVMLHQVNGRWHLSGVLDLADAMLAPAELDLTVPLMDIFRGCSNPQRKLLREVGIERSAEDNGFPALFMAIALVHPFMVFHDSFSLEIQRGFSSIEDIARFVFPN